jgi:cytochrome c
MKICAQCHGKLGLGVRARNLWDGRWWVHVRFCSTHCEARHELERYDAKAHRWRIILAR